MHRGREIAVANTPHFYSFLFLLFTLNHALKAKRVYFDKKNPFAIRYPINPISVYKPTPVYEDVYDITKQIIWSKIIEKKKKRISFVAHILRLDERTPAKKAYKFAREQYHYRSGRPKTTLINCFR